MQVDPKYSNFPSFFLLDLGGGDGDDGCWLVCFCKAQTGPLKTPYIALNLCCHDDVELWKKYLEK